MKRLSLVMALLCVTCLLNLHAQQPWQPASLKLPTRWSRLVSPANALPEYPRPQMVRPQWQNLNGLWDYAITDTNSGIPSRYDGQILVPYPLESPFSGVAKRLTPAQYLWYKRMYSRHAASGKKTLLHFGAVDQIATIFVNGKKVGQHEGGYTEFSFDITSALKNGNNEIVVKVYDPTDQGIWPHGKQVTSPASIYYTPTSGIWQTVWLEEVPVSYIRSLKVTPDVDEKNVKVIVDAPSGYLIRLTTLDNRKALSEGKGRPGAVIEVPLYDPKLWSPADPFLYDLRVQLLKGNKVIDEVTSYFGMRKVSVGKDKKGFYRIFLNNKYCYNLGTLDQGFWPDGLYTAPTDEALRFDIDAIKAMGFNTIRKHIKVEPARWYYHADKIGMLVWQDFVNPDPSLPQGSKPAFEKQLNETMQQLYNHPSVTTWVLFNEKWGQYDQQRLTEMIKRKDPSRLLNAHSGELLWVNEKLRSPSPDAWVSSDIADVHSYPHPMNAPANEGRVQILGEFGGIGVFIPDHQWLSNKSWGYVQVTPAQLLGKYAVMNQHLQLLEREGLAGSIYTQPYDVEGEENGIMTYDREVIKMSLDSLQKIHARLVKQDGGKPSVKVVNADLTDPGMRYSALLQQYIDGNRDAAWLKKLAMTAAQAGDKNGAQRISNDYIKMLKAPLTEEDMLAVSQLSTTTKDPGFTLMHDQREQFEKLLGKRQYVVNVMNMIYNGEIKPVLESGEPDWKAIQEKVKSYGAPGNEILLRAKTIHHLNNQQWEQYVITAKEYLQKFKSNLRDSEVKMLQENIDRHDAQ